MAGTPKLKPKAGGQLQQQQVQISVTGATGSCDPQAGSAVATAGKGEEGAGSQVGKKDNIVKRRELLLSDNSVESS